MTDRERFQRMIDYIDELKQPAPTMVHYRKVLHALVSMPWEASLPYYLAHRRVDLIRELNNLHLNAYQPLLDLLWKE
jgi:hypothetical protein